jgi:serine/threonine protein kinase
VVIVTANCIGGDLHSWLSNHNSAHKTTFKRLFFEIALAVQFLHLNGIAHNDNKPENSFLDASDRVKLADFGCAKDRRFTSDAEKQGTLLYAAPEILKSGTYLATWYLVACHGNR